jgi:hypothetical protein
MSGFEIYEGIGLGHRQKCGMAPFLYRCPNTSRLVQGRSADDASEGEGETYETVTCAACGQMHLLKHATGKVLGTDEE